MNDANQGLGFSYHQDIKTLKFTKLIMLKFLSFRVSFVFLCLCGL